MDLIKTIKDNLVVIYDIKGLLTQLNKPEVPDSIVSFILNFELFLDQTAQNARLKKESAKIFN